MALNFFIAIFPIILILLIIYYKDKNKEPIKLLILLFALGISLCFVVPYLSKLLDFIFPFMKKGSGNLSFIELLLYTFIRIALIEEICKWLVVYVVGYHSKAFDELYDIIVYSIFVSLGFAFLENILYIETAAKLSTGLIRAVVAVPSHAFDAVYMGYFLSLAKQASYNKNRNSEIKNIILSILVPVLLHGIYDFCIISKLKVFTIIFIIFVIVLYVISIIKLKKIIDSNKKIRAENNFCGYCGSIIEGNVCNNCGKTQ